MVKNWVGPVGQSNLASAESQPQLATSLGDLNHQEHHPIRGQECVSLSGVSGQPQHCIGAAEAMAAK